MDVRLLVDLNNNAKNNRCSGGYGWRAPLRLITEALFCQFQVSKATMTQRPADGWKAFLQCHARKHQHGMVVLEVCMLREASFGKSQMLLCIKTECATPVWLQYMLTVLQKWISSSSCSLELWLGWILAPVFTLFLRLENPREKGEENEQEGHLLMIQRIGPHSSGEKVKMSHFPLSVYPFITWALYRWEPVDALSGICCFSAALPSVWHPHLLYVKTLQRAIWLRVMEGGLNSPSEILEPVGKPQLFKCRKSWFYKMLIWSALGTS